MGAVALVAGWTARTLPAGTRIAAIFPDGPYRYLETVFNDAWCHEHKLLDSLPPAEPDEIAEQDECTVTSWTRCSRVRDPLDRDIVPPSGRAAVVGVR